MSRFETGRPDEADTELRALEADLGTYDRAETARYALYRGLTHLTLGNATEAQRWLSFARALSAQDMALLSAPERGRLAAAWRSLGYMPGDS